MATLPGATALSPIIAGRDDELAQLRAHIEATRGGAGRIVLIAGEAGVGKSRLIQETRAYAAGLGLSILTGHCYEQEQLLPYAPLLDILQRDRKSVV